jgi:nucleotide-binding universal stress UspA family protein
MGAFGRILATTDLHEKSAAGLRYAARLAQDSGAELHVLHVTSAHELGDLDRPTHDQTSIREEESEAARRKLVGHIEAELESTEGLRYEPVVVFGSPAMEILRYAREQSCDVIVITVSTRSRVGKLLLGSETLEMLSISDRPVIVVPAGFE